MDAALLSKTIEDIVLERDSVSLPGFGTFVAELVPSTFSDRGYTIHPPYRRLSFSQKETEDGLIAARLVQQNVSEDEFTAFLSELKEELKQNKVIVLPGLGRLRATREDHFFFVPDENLDIYPAGFGLESISLKNNQGFDEEISPRAPSELGRNDNESPSEPGQEGVVISSEGEAVVEKSPEESTEAPEAIPCHTEAPEAISCHTEAPEGPSVSHKKPRPLLIIIIILAALVVLAFIALAVLGRVAPDLVDRILYSPQELETLKTLNL